MPGAEPAVIGYHTTAEAPGAWRNGTRIRKCIWNAGDTHPFDAEGAILGSLGPIDDRYAYFVEWDTTRGIAFAIPSDRIEPLEPATAQRVPAAQPPDPRRSR